MITGLPGTGKSTLAAALAAELGARHLNTDMIREEIGKKGQYDPETKAAIYRTMMHRAEQELRQGRDVVIDGTFYSEELRELFRKLARRRQCDAHAGVREKAMSFAVVTRMLQQHKRFHFRSDQHSKGGLPLARGQSLFACVATEADGAVCLPQKRRRGLILHP